MHLVNPTAEVGTGNTSRVLFAFAAKFSLSAWEIPKSSIYNLLLNSNELIFKMCLLFYLKLC